MVNDKSVACMDCELDELCLKHEFGGSSCNYQSKLEAITADKSCETCGILGSKICTAVCIQRLEWQPKPKAIPTNKSCNTCMNNKKKE